MKKLLSAALAAVLTLSLAACSNAPETKEYTTEELSQILSSAISENSDGMAEVITTDSLNAAIDWLTANKGMSEDEAKVEAAKTVAIPGTSEHQLGLAVDIVDANMQDLTDEQENTETQKWLMANSWRYGFIHRYPNDKTDITGIIYEPWHYRYVGKAAAQDIFNRDITLEEYTGKTNQS